MTQTLDSISGTPTVLLGAFNVNAFNYELMTHTLESISGTHAVLLGDFNVNTFNYAVDVGV